MRPITPKTTLVILGLICFVIIIGGDEDCDSCYDPDVMALKFFFCGLVIMIGSIFFTKKYKVIERIIFNIESHPILETDEATAEVAFSGTGTIEPDKLITSLLAKEPCVYYHSIIEKKVGSGKNRHWKIVKNEIKHVPFYIKDERGRLQVDLTNVDSDLSGHKLPNNTFAAPNHPNSEVDAEKIYRNSHLSKAEAKDIFGKWGTYRKSEFILRPKTKVFVFGYITSRDGTLTLREEKDHPLIISKKTQREYVDQFYKGRNLVFYVHLFVFVGYLVSLLSLEYLMSLPRELLVILYVVVPTLIIGSIVFSIFNRIIKLENRMHNSLSNIDTELRRRHNLIPNLVSVVKEYATYEAATQKLVAALRAKATLSNEAAPNSNPILDELTLIEESYPDLKASENYRSLMTSLVDTEERLAYSRSFYNRSVRKYNTLIQQFPFNFVASIFSKKPRQFLNLF